MLIEDALNLLDEMLDSSLSLPFSGGRCVVDIDRVRDIIDDVRMSIPAEIQQAENLLAQKESILSTANEQAESIIKKAEDRARVILAQDAAVKASQKKAAEIIAQAQTQSRDMRMATQKFADNILKNAEDSLTNSLGEIKKTRGALRGNPK